MFALPDHTPGERGVTDDRPQDGPGGAGGNSVGVYICTDLACSLYVRGRKVPASGGRFKESLTLEEQVVRTRTNLAAFLRTLYVA